MHRRLAATAALGTLAATALALQGGAPATAADSAPLVTSWSALPVTESLTTAATSSLRSTLGAAGLVASDDVFTVKNAERDSTGATHVRMTRTYRGLPVVGGDVVLHRDAKGAATGTSRTLTAPLTLSATPALSATALLGKVGLGDNASKPQLVVDTLGHAPSLAWKVTTSGTQADGTPSRIDHYYDASSGRQLRQEQQIETIDGSGQSLYLGTVPLDITKSGSSYQLKSPKHANTYTTDLKGASDSQVCQIFGNCPKGTLITSPTTSFGNGSNSNPATAGVDAQRGSDLTWDFYKSAYGRDGIFNNPKKGSYNRVHYGKNYVNAFWDGEKMTYGDGDGTNYGPLVSLDVAGHEMSHGVTENTAGLTYSGESGGLNEATSDIFGTMVEFYANDAKDPGDYLIGEQFDLKKHQGFRRMDDPAKDGSSQSCYGPTTRTVDVHYSSGVGNHFFYLLSEGSGAKTLNGVAYSSPTCNGSTVSGIGRDAAAKIWYRALTTYFTSGTTYSQAKTATVKAATDLYGASSTQVAAVNKAWAGVNVS